MLDIQIFHLLNGLAGQSLALDAIIVFCASYLAYGIVAAFLIFLYVADYPWRQKIEIAWAALIATILSRGIITEVIRYFFPRERPFTALGLDKAHTLLTDPASSLPSGHATFFFALSTVVYLHDKKWGMGFFALTLAITLGRVAAGVHYPSDILAGALIGVFCGYLVYLAARRFTRRKIN